LARSPGELERTEASSASCRRKLSVNCIGPYMVHVGYSNRVRSNGP